MSHRRVVIIVVVAGWLGWAAGPARAGTSTLSQSVSVDPALSDATFTLDFPHPPDFAIVDSHGRPADSFQYEIAGSPMPGEPALTHLTAIIRGDEIPSAGALHVRSAFPPDLSDPNSGGWGAIVDTVPFNVKGDQLSFTVPLKDLGAPDGHFAYRAFTMQFGVTDASAESQAVPLPPAAWAGLAMLAVVMGALGCRTVATCRAATVQSVTRIYAAR
ncbi:MAG: motif putative anchor domain protein [Phycisphaerales bacterium]|nr:motif putative anchor domain protein [Phycisphaerales bacterium]